MRVAKKDFWIWDGERASKYDLKERLFCARSHGYKGVRIKGFKNGEWATLKEYPVEVPLI